MILHKIIPDVAANCVRMFIITIFFRLKWKSCALTKPMVMCARMVFYFIEFRIRLRFTKLWEIEKFYVYFFIDQYNTIFFSFFFVCMLSRPIRNCRLTMKCVKCGQEIFGYIPWINIHYEADTFKSKLHTFSNTRSLSLSPSGLPFCHPKKVLLYKHVCKKWNTHTQCKLSNGLFFFFSNVRFH